jgi:hypothetical protein
MFLNSISVNVPVIRPPMPSLKWQRAWCAELYLARGCTSFCIWFGWRKLHNTTIFEVRVSKNHHFSEKI